MGHSVQRVQTEFRHLVAEATKEGLERLEPIVSGKRRLGSYYRWPSMSVSKSGLPSFSETPFSGPTDYKSAFMGYKPPIPASGLGSFQNLVSFVKRHEYIMGRLFPIPAKVDEGKEKEPIPQKFPETSIYLILAELIDRYVHINQTLDFSEGAFQRVYEPYARCLFQEKLSVDICVPVLFLKFSFDQIELGPGLSLERMDEASQLARAALEAYGTGVRQFFVLSAATHALVLKDRSIQNPSVWSLANRASDVNTYSLALVDNFFAALRIVTGLHTGYAQLLLRPHGWARRYKADLPPLEGTSTRAYPNWFEDGYWLNEEIPEVEEETAREVGNVFVKLLDVSENSVRIAVKRLNLCFLRDEEEDRILDSTIGLEALLPDDERQEMTHKLAMRIGALAKVSASFSKPPYQIFREVKKIYEYRSAVVHGSTKSDKKREIVSSEDRRIPASSLAVDYLRVALRVLIDYPKYRKPETIDKELLLGSNQT